MKGLSAEPADTRRPGSIHLAVSGREIVLRADECDHVAGSIFDHHHGAIADLLVAQPNDMMLKRTPAESVQFKIERGPHFGAAAQMALLPDEIDKMRRIEIRRTECELNWPAVLGASTFRRGDQMIPFHPLQDPFLALECARRDDAADRAAKATVVIRRGTPTRPGSGR